MKDLVSELEKRITSAGGTKKIDLMNRLSAQMEDLNPRRALTVSQEAYELAQRLGYENGMGQSLLCMCYACRRLSLYEKSSAYIFSAIEIFERLGDAENHIRALNLAGGNYFYFGQYDLSLEYFLKGLEMAKQTDNQDQQASILNNIGEIYRDLKKYDQALAYYSQSLAISQEIGNHLHMAATHINIGQIHRSMGKYSLALEFYHRSLEMLQQTSSKLFEGECLNEMGVIYENLDDREKALSHYLQSLDIFEEQGNRFYKIDVMMNLAGYYMKDEESEKALDFLHKALEDAREISAASRVIRICAVLADYLEKSGDFRNALQYLRECHRLEKETATQELEKKLNAAAAQFKMEQAHKEAEIYRLKNVELKQKAEEIEKKAWELEASYRNVTVISNIGQNITSTLDLGKILNIVYTSVNSLMDASVFGIGLYHEADFRIEYKLFIDRSRRLPPWNTYVQNRSSLAAWCINNRSELVIHDMETEYRQYVEADYLKNMTQTPKSIVYYPLMVEDRIIGMITVQSYKKQAYTYRELDIIRALASYIAIAVNNSQKSEEIREKAMQLEIANQKLEGLLSLDDLTDIPNRRTFKKLLEMEWRRSLREGIPISVIILDIDFFKKYNDWYGHPAGDECLKRVAKTLTACVKRSMDLAARYGGEEFIVLLPNTDDRGAAHVAEFMRKAVENLGITHPNSKIAPVVTISLGTATVVPFEGMSPQELVSHADKALYKAKQAGRNQVGAAEIETPVEGSFE